MIYKGRDAQRINTFRGLACAMSAYVGSANAKSITILAFNTLRRFIVTISENINGRKYWDPNPCFPNKSIDNKRGNWRWTPPTIVNLTTKAWTLKNKIHSQCLLRRLTLFILRWEIFRLHTARISRLRSSRMIGCP